MVSFSLARGAVAHLISFALFLQAVEILRMIKMNLTTNLYSKETLGLDFQVPISLRTLAIVEIAIAITSFGFPGLLTITFLFMTHICICARFRGSLAGGSDAMTTVVLTGLVLSYVTKNERFAQLGLFYIAIHLLLSYFRAGISKFRVKEWRDGRALPGFLAQSFFADVRALGAWLSAHSRLSYVVCWCVMIFETALVASPLLRPWFGLILGAVVIFHFAIYVAFGLNRFFWVWLSAWPSVFYAAELLGRQS